MNEQVSQGITDFAAGGGLESVGNIGTGIYSLIQARKQEKEYKSLIKNLQNPTFQIPTEATSALNLSKALAESKMFAGQTQAENAIDKSVARATSDAVRSSTSSQDLLSAITKINEGEMDKRNDLMEYASQDYLKRQGDLIKAKNDYANWQLEKQDRDVYDRFARDSSAASALKNAYMRNRYNGVQGTVGGVMDVATSLIPAVL